MNLFDDFREMILSPTDVVQKAIQERLAPPNNTPEYIKNNFSDLIEALQLDAYNIYLKGEEDAGKSVIEDRVRERLVPYATVEDVVQATGSMFSELDRFFLSLTQGRRNRAGRAFEIILKTLFRRLNYPFEEQQVINGKTDFLMPHRRHWDNNPMDCIIFTVKRSLRERWRQIVTEGTRGLGFYLATIDEAVSRQQLTEMMRNRIYLVVPRRIKDDTRIYSAQSNVISFEDFFTHHLDPAIARWKATGII